MVDFYFENKELYYPFASKGMKKFLNNLCYVHSG
jgi:hypothetical protein